MENESLALENSQRHRLPTRVEHDTALSKREMYYVQHYLLVDDSWWFTYNHSIVGVLAAS